MGNRLKSTPRRDWFPTRFQGEGHCSVTKSSYQRPDQLTVAQSRVVIAVTDVLSSAKKSQAWQALSTMSS